MRKTPSWIPKFIGVLALGGLLVSAPAFAGEFKFGEGVGSLDVDDNGKLTAAGRKAAITKLDKIPGEDAWDCNVWITLDGGRDEGPLYIEFWQKVNGNDAIVYRHDMDDYDGRKYVLVNIELEGNSGFNKDRKYTVKAVQVNSRDRDIVLAKGSIELINTGREPEPEGDDDGGGGDDGEQERESASQDELDSLAGPDEEMKDKSVEEAPPPVEPSKKGCAVDADGGFSGLAVLMLAGLAFRRRDD